MNITEREAFSKISQMNGNLQPDALRREMEDAEDRNHHVMRRRMFEAMRMANFEDRVHPRFRRVNLCGNSEENREKKQNFS